MISRASAVYDKLEQKQTDEVKRTVTEKYDRKLKYIDLRDINKPDCGYVGAILSTC